MRRWKPSALALAAVAVIGVPALWMLTGREERSPEYDWECSRCRHQFRQAVHDTTGDRPVIPCRKCGETTAERRMHFQCRSCWEKFELRGANATLENLVCSRCGSRAVRDLDHPVPGDDEPVEGGQPRPHP